MASSPVVWKIQIVYAGIQGLVLYHKKNYDIYNTLLLQHEYYGTLLSVTTNSTVVVVPEIQDIRHRVC